jgi:flagellar basal-body rod protein FlgG
MDSGLYSTYTGLKARAEMLEVISNNLANTNTTAFKGDESFLRVFNRALSESTVAPLDRVINDSAVVQGTAINFSNGSFLKTGRDLDVALEGDGFLAVETPAGIRYTRNGNFHMNSKGQLLTSDGFPVLGDKGAIQLPRGTVSISQEGEIQVGPNRVDKLKIVDFKDRKRLEKMGSSLFQPVAGGIQEEAAKGMMVRQGFLEQSNINPVRQMTEMLSILRQFESLQKSLNMIMNVLNERAINQVGKI